MANQPLRSLGIEPGDPGRTVPEHLTKEHEIFLASAVSSLLYSGTEACQAARLVIESQVGTFGMKYLTEAESILSRRISQ